MSGHSSKGKAIHLRSVRLFNNAGICYPICRSFKGGFLDVEVAVRMETTGNVNEVTCKNCLKQLEKMKFLF